MTHSIKDKQAHCLRRSYSPPSPLTAPCGMLRPTTATAAAAALAAWLPWRPSPQIQAKEAGWRRPLALCRPQQRPLRGRSCWRCCRRGSGVGDCVVVVGSCCVAIDSLSGGVDGHILRCRGGLGGGVVGFDALELAIGRRRRGEIGYIIFRPSCVRKSSEN
jgi:hypothetical protein